jgi:hypothetical protein
MRGGTFKEWKFECNECRKITGVWGWSYDKLDEPRCSNPACADDDPIMWPVTGPRSTVMIATDDIPGGIEIRHLDPEPKRYYSKTEIKRAANERGWTISGDTPKPYNIPWSGRKRGD